MSKILPDLLYAKSHEWVRKASSPRVVTVGITDFAQAALGDVTYLQLPEAGKTFKKGEVFGSVESVKAVSELYAPVSGKVLKTNAGLANDPGPVNTDPYATGWMLEVEMSDESELASLLKAEAYAGVAQ
jgi:glycine cleavage system H protein